MSQTGSVALKGGTTIHRTHLAYRSKELIDRTVVNSPIRCAKFVVKRQNMLRTATVAPSRPTIKISSV